MVKNIKDSKQKKQTKDKKESRNMGKNVTGRPIRSAQEKEHEEHYQKVKNIFEITSLLAQHFKNYQQILSFPEGQQQSFFSFNINFDSCVLEESQKKIYVNKNSICFWIHELCKSDENKDRHIEQILNLILFWFYKQNILPQFIYKQFTNSIVIDQLKLDLFSNDEIQQTNIKNLFITLIIELSALQDISLIQKTNNDYFEQCQKLINNNDIFFLSTYVENRKTN